MSIERLHSFKCKESRIQDAQRTPANGSFGVLAAGRSCLKARAHVGDQARALVVREIAREEPSANPVNAVRERLIGRVVRIKSQRENLRTVRGELPCNRAL